MANKKKRQATRLPKTIAGVAIGKDLRSAIKPILRFAGHPLVSDLLAVALLAGAERLTEGGKSGKRAAGHAKGAKDKDSGRGGKAGKGSPVGLHLAVAAGEIASHIVTAYQAAPAKRRQSGKAKAPAKEPRSNAEVRPAGTSRRRK